MAKAKTKAATKQRATSKTRAKPRTTAKQARESKPARMAPRADFGKPIDGFFAKQPPPLRAILVELRKLVESTVPDARSSIKWGMPFYMLSGKMMCALGGHKSHVNLILSGPTNIFADPDKRLTGTSKLGRHLKLTSLDQLPRAEVRGWVRAAAKHARGG